MINFDELPLEVQSEAKNTLKVYDEITVIFEYGQYHVTTGTCLKNVYANDHKVIGRYFAKDIFTEEERTINYIEEFISYPFQYKGKKDWSMIKEMELLRKEHKHAKIKLVNGNAIIDSITDIRI
jgi:hypothetical protein